MVAKLAPIILLAACSPQVSLLVGPRVDNQQQTVDGGVTVIISQDLPEGPGWRPNTCAYIHQSTFENGPPWRTERFEVTTDGAYCGWTWGNGRKAR